MHSTEIRLTYPPPVAVHSVSAVLHSKLSITYRHQFASVVTDPDLVYWEREKKEKNCKLIVISLVKPMKTGRPHKHVGRVGVIGFPFWGFGCTDYSCCCVVFIFKGKIKNYETGNRLSWTGRKLEFVQVNCFFFVALRCWNFVSFIWCVAVPDNLARVDRRDPKRISSGQQLARTHTQHPTESSTDFEMFYVEY